MRKKRDPRHLIKIEKLRLWARLPFLQEVVRQENKLSYKKNKANDRGRRKSSKTKNWNSEFFLIFNWKTNHQCIRFSFLNLFISLKFVLYFPNYEVSKLVRKNKRQMQQKQPNPTKKQKNVSNNDCFILKMTAGARRRRKQTANIKSGAPTTSYTFGCS